MLIMGFQLCTFMYSWFRCLSRICSPLQISLKKPTHVALIRHLPYRQGSRCPPGRSWLCDPQPPWTHWGSADHSGWTPQCCGSAWGSGQIGWKGWSQGMKEVKLSIKLKVSVKSAVFVVYKFSPTSSCKKKRFIWNIAAINLATLLRRRQTDMNNICKNTSGRIDISLVSLFLSLRNHSHNRLYQTLKVKPCVCCLGRRWLSCGRERHRAVPPVLGHRTTTAEIRSQAAPSAVRALTVTTGRPVRRCLL